MNVTVDINTIFIFVNIVATFIGLAGLWVKLEHRLTKMETALEMHGLLKVKGGLAHEQNTGQ